MMNGCYGCAHPADEHTGPGFSCRHTDTSTVTKGDFNKDGITVTTDTCQCDCLEFKP